MTAARSAASARSKRTRRAACSRRAPISTPRCSRRSSMRPIPAESVAILPSYPQMLNDLSRGDGEMLRSVDAARASLTQLDQSLGDLDEFLKELDHASIGFNGDISPSEYTTLAADDEKVCRRVRRRRGGGVAGLATLQLCALASALDAYHVARTGNLAAALLDAAVCAATALRIERYRATGRCCATG